MAGISTIAIPGLTWDSSKNEAIMDNNDRILKFQVGLIRDVDGWTYLTTWTKADIKVKIEDAQGNVLIEDISWKEVGDDNFKYNTSDGNYGKYSIITFQRQLNFVFSNIGKITVRCKRRNASDNDYYEKILNFLEDESPLYRTVQVSGKTSFSVYAYTYTAYKKPIYASRVCSVSNPSEIKIKGKIGDYTNYKYHNGTIEFEFPTMEYMGVPRYPQQIKLSAGGKEYTATDTPEVDIGEETEIKAPYEITLYIGNASYTKTVNTGMYPLSSFVEQELDLSEMTAIAYDVFGVSEFSDDQGDGYLIEQCSVISGGIKIKDLENSPYIFENDKPLSLIVIDANNHETEVATKKNYTITGNKISLGYYYPFSKYSYKFSNNSGGWIKNNQTNSNYTFFEGGEKYALVLGMTPKFDSSSVSIKVPIDGYINYNAAPIILSKALDYKVKYDDETCGDTMILNPQETLEVSINENYVFFPSLQNNWGQLGSNIADYEIYYTLSQQQDYYLDWKNSVATNEAFRRTHQQILGLDTNQDYYTHFLTFGLKVEENGNSSGNSAAQKMNTVRIGRVRPMVISKCEIKGDALTYYLSDYGGDKTASLPASTFISYDSSLSRSGKEKLTLVFKDGSGETLGELVISAQLLGSKEEARKRFYENVPIKLPLTSLTTDTEIIAKISQIEGTYNYSYSGSNSAQTVSFTLTSEKIDNIANKPTWSLRKNGVIINGKPGQQITPVSESDETAGKYFIEINALEQNDRIIVNFPIEGSATTVSGEIYYNSEKNKIILKGFELE